MTPEQFRKRLHALVDESIAGENKDLTDHYRRLVVELANETALLAITVIQSQGCEPERYVRHFMASMGNIFEECCEA